MKSFLCIGGPCDGRRVSRPDFATYRVRVMPPVSFDRRPSDAAEPLHVQDYAYYPVRFTGELGLLVYERLSSDRALEALFDLYPQERPK